MKFIIVSEYDTYIIEAEDFTNAAIQAQHDCGDKGVRAIIRMTGDI